MTGVTAAPARRYRIGLLVDSLVGGGAERMAVNFAEAFRQAGHDAHVIIIRDEVAHDVRAVPVHALCDSGVMSAWRPLNKWLLARRLRAVVATIEADGQRFDFFISNAEDMDRISAIARLPWVFIRYRNSLMTFIRTKIGQASGLKRTIRSLRWFRKFRRIYGGRHIVAISQAMQDELLNEVGIKPASITTIYNPFNFARIRALAAESADLPAQPYIIYVARMSSRKDQETLVRAYAAAQVPELLVLLGGTTSAAERDYEHHLRGVIAELGIADRVLLPGFRANPYPWIRNARLFAMSSRAEGLPLVLIEALILGTPAVSTDCPTGPSEILTGELAGFLSPVGDVAALTRTIVKALASYPAIDDPMLARFADNYAIEQYLKHYNCVSTRFSA